MKSCVESIIANRTTLNIDDSRLNFEETVFQKIITWTLPHMAAEEACVYNYVMFAFQNCVDKLLYSAWGHDLSSYDTISL